MKLLLSIAGLSRSTYYFNLKREDLDNKNGEIIEALHHLFEKHKKRYGYRRMTHALRELGFIVNTKKVRRLMSKYGLKCIRKRKSQYRSYQGEVGKVAENQIKREFQSHHPNEKWYSDVTEFRFEDQKVYLSPILDGHGGYIISYDISLSPNLNQIQTMFKKAFNQEKMVQGCIFHTDQGWQYQHQFTQEILKEHGLIQSMSRKGNCIDNAMMESFFGSLKTELYYGYEDDYETIDDLINAIHEYMNYYNTERIKTKLKGLTPEQFRNQSYS